MTNYPLLINKNYAIRYKEVQNFKTMRLFRSFVKFDGDNTQYSYNVPVDQFRALLTSKYKAV